ncbi:MAG: HAD-IA family hydrolase [Gammaproteobacteria bacterium]|nr:HAD-IA family hydrolase [Gammaproteobacteria bacterium]
MTIQSVLFDLDGTFADTAPDLHYALDQVLLSRGRMPLPLEKVRPAVSHGSRAMLKVGFDVSPGDPDYGPLKDDFLSIYLANIANRTTLFDGMHSLLAAFETGGISWGIVTNKPAWLTDPLLEGLGLSQRAACIVSGDTTDHSKPHPEPILHACRLAGVAPQQAIYVGDARRDIEAGNRAGATTLVALFGYLAEDDDPDSWNADGAVAHPLDILDWLD